VESRKTPPTQLRNYGRDHPGEEGGKASIAAIRSKIRMRSGPSSFATVRSRAWRLGCCARVVEALSYKLRLHIMWKSGSGRDNSAGSGIGSCPT